MSDSATATTEDKVNGLGACDYFLQQGMQAIAELLMLCSLRSHPR